MTPVEQLLGNKMDDLPFPLDPAIDRHHRRFENDPPAFFEECRPAPVSSSMVMNMTPLADPGFCRTSTSPAV
ncbi:hypothetical protein HA459_28295 (plasmid) [Rhizobium leguminosarum bv. trifolii]|nr:hypothetical protein [Rhizobium leguminosarum]MBB4525485.1 hypothetical protein [Rhizobium leguminosarum]QIO75874.1 hypothetical protein HA459_28295 [Rhizobium leguminosarum bv. trifolii]QIO82884.1 hypothetical protein HA460_28330 [Rhizobium leguminosarum bv. trifolii]WSH76030.1 hypothetical protein U8Q02_35380 [Rhizobium leguminosarum]